MHIDRITYTNFRGFVNQPLELAPRLNIFIGENNAGKSSLFLPLLALQDGQRSLRTEDIRVGQTGARVEIEPTAGSSALRTGTGIATLAWIGSKDEGFVLRAKSASGDWKGRASFPGSEPSNPIFPFLGKRKVDQFSNSSAADVYSAVLPNLANLNHKVDWLQNQEIDAHRLFAERVEKVLRFRISSTPTGSSKAACLTVDRENHILLNSMGEGVGSLLGLIWQLSTAGSRLFLIEEPENDLHPRALKEVLEFIIEASANNQFLISTHSGIVLRALGSVSGAKAFRVVSEASKPPTSRIEEIEPLPAARARALESLGYELLDSDVWSGWLFMEESSAERIVREVLIPLFVPSLDGRLRTFAAGGSGDLMSRTESFHRQMVYVSLTPMYQGRVWVMIDAGAKEEVIADAIRGKWRTRGCSPEQVIQLGRHQFEEYLPSERFGRLAEAACKESNFTRRQKLKESLVLSVLQFARDEPETARTELAISAAEVIGHLKGIEAVLRSRSV